MYRYSAKLIVAAMMSGAISAAASAQTAPNDPVPPATMPPAEPAAPPASARPDPQAPPAEGQTINVGDQEIRSFALALVELDKIRRQYQPQIEAASAEQRPALEAEANAKMTAVVEEKGLDPQTFNAISTSARENPKLEAKIRAELAKAAPQEPARR